MLSGCVLLPPVWKSGGRCNISEASSCFSLCKGRAACNQLGTAEMWPECQKGMTVQVQESLAQRTSRLQEQQQLPVFKSTALEGSPVDYQPRSTPPPVDSQARSTSPVDSQAPATSPVDSQPRSAPLSATARTGLAPESARRPSMAEHPPGTSPSRPERPSFGPPSPPPPAVGSSPSRPPRPSFGPPAKPPASERMTPVVRNETSRPSFGPPSPPLPDVESSPSRPPRPSFGPPAKPPASERMTPVVRNETPRPSFGPPSKPPASERKDPVAGYEAPRPSFGPPSKPPAPARKTPVVRYETSQVGPRTMHLQAVPYTLHGSRRLWPCGTGGWLLMVKRDILHPPPGCQWALPSLCPAVCEATSWVLSVKRDSLCCCKTR